MNRKPPVKIRRALRKEVGFGCPIPGCGNPYLCWHHFDPPWNEKEHHDQNGMIALCAEHHAKADAGAYTREQLHDIKRNAIARAMNVRGKFDWMRRNLLAVVGGNFYYETPIIFQVKGQPIIWFERDGDGYLLLNIIMLTKSGQPRIVVENNFWSTIGEPTDFECPPSGKLINVSYPNGDMLRVEYFELQSSEDAIARYDSRNWRVDYPITAVEVRNLVAGTDIDFGPRETKMPGIIMRNCFFSNGNIAINLS